MKMNIKIVHTLVLISLILLFTVCCLLPAVVHAWPRNERPGATFLLIPPGARAAGSGYAYTARIDPCLCNYYNAAGLAFTDSPAITAEYLGYLTGLHPDMHLVYVAGCYQEENSALGIQGTYLALAPIEIRDEQGTYIGTRVPWRLAVNINYAKSISDKCAIGFGFKIISQRYSNPGRDFNRYANFGIDASGTSLTWALDGNFLYRILPYLDIGCVIQNIGPDIGYTEDSDYWPGYDPLHVDPLPYLFRAGFSFALLRLDYLICMVSADFTKLCLNMFRNDEYSFWQHVEYEFLNEPWKGIGLECAVYDIVTLRGGYFYDGEGRRSGFTYGAGLSYAGIALDIGIDEEIFDFSTKNRRISLTYKF